jgi:hypothetical protein
MNGKARGALLAMGLVTTAVLVYEVALTRLLSVVLWYDLIQIALVDSWAATAAGAFALSESYLYTVEVGWEA